MVPPPPPSDAIMAEEGSSAQEHHGLLTLPSVPPVRRVFLSEAGAASMRRPAQVPAAGGRVAVLKGRAEVQERKADVREQLTQRLGSAGQVCKERRAILEEKGFQRLQRPAKVGNFLVADPWDRLRGRVREGVNEHDVLNDGNCARLRLQAAMALTQHWAPDCSTFSRALEKSIPGAPEGTGPKAMRSHKHPAGLPWEELVSRFKGTAGVVKKKLDDHTRMANLAAEECLKAVREGRYVIIENPGQSHLWQLPLYKELAKLPGMQWITLHNCAFGGKRRKYTGLLSNVPGLEEHCGKLCLAREENAPCDFSGLPHLSWKGSWNERSASTVTDGEAEYPAGMCEAMASAVVQCPAAAPELAARLPFAFLEVFSGPNAPLTTAVKQAFTSLGCGAAAASTPRALCPKEVPEASEPEAGTLPPRV